jgi:hypothetical protein
MTERCDHACAHARTTVQSGFVGSTTPSKAAYRMRRKRRFRPCHMYTMIRDA